MKLVASRVQIGERPESILRSWFREKPDASHMAFPKIVVHPVSHETSY